VAGPFAYGYELRRDGAIVATGEISRDEELHVGDRFRHGRIEVVVQAIVPALGARPARLLLRAFGR
jgi:hypothetical protein